MLISLPSTQPLYVIHAVTVESNYRLRRLFHPEDTPSPYNCHVPLLLNSGGPNNKTTITVAAADTASATTNYLHGVCLSHNTFITRCYRKILHISYKDHVTNEEVSAKILQAIGPHEDLTTIVKRRKLQWYGLVSRPACNAQ